MPHPFQTVRKLFEEARDVPKGQRPAWLRSAGGDDNKRTRANWTEIGARMSVSTAQGVMRSEERGARKSNPT